MVVYTRWWSWDSNDSFTKLAYSEKREVEFCFKEADGKI